MAHKKKTNDKVPAGTGDAVDSGSTITVITSELEMSENTIQNPNPTRGDGDPPPAEKSSGLPEPSEQSALANLDPEELALGNQLQEMLNIINKHMDEVESI
ncbi:hypothetical protein M422DRAFT_256794 [Sphaerobolus stellatus SS14]|uniref:Uncharacterized protein n=1 Tax=Sphaerobolus stellatus (strain SS14) TaxID=990650 RepID=A0A0C9UZE8_SPHS4|nr:hypothetical protein M422DRAFT_256794 [Sphaerobolus stellatus SS14]